MHYTYTNKHMCLCINCMNRAQRELEAAKKTTNQSQ